MAGFTVKLSGFDQLQKRLSKAVAVVPKEVDAELYVAAQEIRQRAIQEAPADQGLLRAEIQTNKSSALNWGVFSNALYSGYLEFGTRSNVVIPAGLQEVANEIRQKSGSTLDAKQAIFQWCKRKGIDERLWYSIFIKIMVQGIKPRSFFFKQLGIVQPKLISNLENVLKQV